MADAWTKRGQPGDSPDWEAPNVVLGTYYLCSMTADAGDGRQKRQSRAVSTRLASSANRYCPRKIGLASRKVLCMMPLIACWG